MINSDSQQFWTIPAKKLVEQLGSVTEGLTAAEARRRLRIYGPNRLRRAKRTDALTLLLAQFKSPLIIILLGAVILSFFLREPVAASIIIAIVLLSSVLGFWQEKRAADAVKGLLAIVRIDARVLRDGVERDVPAEEVVPGDICVLNAGDIIPGDAAILESKDLFVQILLNNFLTDFPAMAISTDSVDQELVQRPRRWDIGFIRNFMIVFGIVSSVFDFLTFAVLVFVLKATDDVFRRGWFVESVMTEVLIILVMRIWKPFYRSLPSRPLLLAMILVLVITLALPYSPLSGMLGLTPLPVSSIALLGLITALYAGVSEFTKKLFYARLERKGHEVKRLCMSLLVLKCDSSLMIGTQYGTRALC